MLVKYLGDIQKGLDRTKLIPRFSWYISTYNVGGPEGVVGLRWPLFSKYIQQSNGSWHPGWVIYWGGCPAGVELTGGHSAIVFGRSIGSTKI